MEFTNPETKAAYKPLVDKDRGVYVPYTDKHGAYEGLLSGVPPAVAESMVSQGVNVLQRISSPGKTTAALKAE